MKEKNEERPVSHIIALVLGIISALTTFFWYIALPCGITAIVLGVNTYKKMGSKMGLAGMITGIVGVAFTLLIYIFFFIILVLQNGGLY